MRFLVCGVCTTTSWDFITINWQLSELKSKSCAKEDDPSPEPGPRHFFEMYLSATINVRTIVQNEIVSEVKRRLLIIIIEHACIDNFLHPPLITADLMLSDGRL